jgi:hypothetical protein
LLKLESSKEEIKEILRIFLNNEKKHLLIKNLFNIKINPIYLQV